MPNVPLRPWSEFKELRKLKSVLDRRVELYVSQREIKQHLDEINRPLFEKLSVVLPDGVKSFDYDGFQITPQQGAPRRTFQREKLLNTTFKCPHCGEGVTVPVKTIDRAYSIGKLPKPTVVVREVKVGMAGEGEDEE